MEIARLRELLVAAARARANLYAIEADPERRGRLIHREADDTEHTARSELGREASAALPALLDRLEAAETVVEAAREESRSHGPIREVTQAEWDASTRLRAALRRYDEVRR